LLVAYGIILTHTFKYYIIYKNKKFMKFIACSMKKVNRIVKTMKYITIIIVINLVMRVFNFSFLNKIYKKKNDYIIIQLKNSFELNL